VVREAAAEIEELGFDHLWSGENPGREAMTQAALLLAATSRITVATAIARFDRRDPVAATGAHRALSEAYPGRSRRPAPGNRPTESLCAYLEAMDGRGPVACWPRRPRMLRLVAQRADGAHPHFVPVEHTAWAREILGPDAFLGVEQGVVLNANDAREIARKEATIYLEQAPHDQANLRRLGFTDADLADGGSDRLIDALVAFGSEGTAKRVRAHLDAGADHGCVWVLTGDNRLPRAEWRALAGALR
jgi:probable F420-dependent oxidoreductase